jgi:hypothetical protein
LIKRGMIIEWEAKSYLLFRSLALSLAVVRLIFFGY